ncbi:MAG: hypothetical protein ACO1N1_25995 [Dyadobacter fermentans]
MKKSFRYLLVGIFCFFFWACKHEEPRRREPNDDKITSEVGDVFVSGSIVRDNKRKACYWKNDTIQVLDESPGAAFDIFVTDKEILIGGESNGKPCYWRNGEKVLIHAPGEGIVTGIQVKNDLVYAIGYIHEGPVRTRGFLLKGSDVSYLNRYSGYANDFVFDGPDLYVAGVDDGRPCYWKNQVLVTLSERGDVVAMDAVNGKVIVAGENRRGDLTGVGLWKDRQFETLNSSFLSLKKLKIFNGKTYLLGNGVTLLDKNGSLSTGFVDTDGKQEVVVGESANSCTEVNDMCITKSGMYVLGSSADNGQGKNGKLCYWLNNKIHNITSEQEAMGSAIFVK